MPLTGVINYVIAFIIIMLTVSNAP